MGHGRSSCTPSNRMAYPHRPDRFRGPRRTRAIRRPSSTTLCHYGTAMVHQERFGCRRRAWPCHRGPACSRRPSSSRLRGQDLSQARRATRSMIPPRRAEPELQRAPDHRGAGRLDRLTMDRDQSGARRSCLHARTTADPALQRRHVPAGWVTAAPRAHGADPGSDVQGPRNASPRPALGPFVRYMHRSRAAGARA